MLTIMGHWSEQKHSVVYNIIHSQYFRLDHRFYYIISKLLNYYAFVYIILDIRNHKYLTQTPLKLRWLEPAHVHKRYKSGDDAQQKM